MKETSDLKSYLEKRIEPRLFMAFDDQLHRLEYAFEEKKNNDQIMTHCLDRLAELIGQAAAHELSARDFKETLQLFWEIQRKVFCL